MIGGNVLAVVVYLFSNSLKDEASDRCNVLKTDGQFTINHCVSKVSQQLTWEIIGLTCVYLLLSLLGIRVIMTTQNVLQQNTQKLRLTTFEASSRTATSRSSFVSDTSFDQNVKHNKND